MESFKIDLVTRHDNTTYYPNDDIEEYGLKLNSLNFVDVKNKICIKTIWQHLKNASSYILAYYLKKKYGIKWIAFWNDPFPAYLWIEPYGHGNNPEMVKKCKRIIQIMKCADEYVYPNQRLANLCKFLCDG